VLSNLHHEAESLKPNSVLSWSRNSQEFMEFRVYNDLPVVPILIQMHPFCFCKIHFNIILSSTPRSSSDLFISGFRSELRIHFSSVPCILHVPLISVSLIFPDRIIQPIKKFHKPFDSPSCSLKTAVFWLKSVDLHELFYLVSVSVL
jgi:hypothetical protein